MSKEWALGIDIGGTKIIVAQVDKMGNILRQKQIPTQSKLGFAAVIQDIVNAVKEVEAEVKSKPTCAGVGMAGQILPNTGVVKFAPNLSWHNVPLQESLHQFLGIPVFVTNDVRAGTWGEWKFGAGRHSDDLICLMIGTGIGGGVIINGKPLTGSNNSAGELGHVTIDWKGSLCTCGNIGCIETIAAGWGIAKRAQEAVAQNPGAGTALLRLTNGNASAISAREVTAAASNDDPLSKKIIEDAIDAITLACIGYVNIFNPRRLILGGGLGFALPNLVERVRKGVKKHGLSAATEKLEVLPAELKRDVVAIGAAGYALNYLDSKT